MVIREVVRARRASSWRLNERWTGGLGPGLDRYVIMRGLTAGHELGAPLAMDYCRAGISNGALTIASLYGAGAIRSILVWIRLPWPSMKFWDEAVQQAVLWMARESSSIDECMARSKRLGFTRACIRLDPSRLLQLGS